jgi:hypothetical protein
MKKHLLLLSYAFLLFCFSSSAQVFSKKDKLFGATAGLSFSSDTNVPNNPYPSQHSNNIAFMPSFAWAIKDNLALGIKGNFNYWRLVTKGPNLKYVNTSLIAGPEFFLRKYRPLKDRFGVFFNHGIDLNYTRSTVSNNQDEIKSTAWGGGYNFTPGAFYKFGDRFMGEASFGGLALQYSKNNDGTKSFDAGITFLTYFNIGIQYIIRKNRS